MTMSMVGPGLTTTSYKKRKPTKRTKNQQLQFEQQHREYNKSMKRIHAHDQIMSLEDYDLYVRGLWKPKVKATKFKEYKPTATFTEQRKQYPSAGNGVGIAVKKEAIQYTGERKLLGIATMHKSNMVPIFEDNKHEAIEIARMRR
tara:strand:- start:231 stop:665 length:435 start_codon:yes stop_codon:yes gene_type:complete